LSDSPHLVLVPHTHWDREWYRTHEQFRFRLVELIDRVLDLLERDPAFRHFTLDGQSIVLDDYLEVRPEARERLAKLVAAGRLLVGPWYVLPDEWLVSGEALVRNLRRGLDVADRLGGAMRLGYVPDQFGHVGQLPQIFAGLGFDAAALWRGVGGGVDSTLFDWEAPDGTRILTVYLIRSYSNAAYLPRDPEALAGRLRSEIEGLRRHSAISSLLLMNGTDHALPDPGVPATVEAALERLPGVTAEIGTLPGFVARARAEAPAERPLHRGELRSGLRSPLLPGCASARTPQKQRDFENDRLLVRDLEPLAAWLGALGGEVDTAWLDLAWRVALENHPHDSICGCSVDAVHDQMESRFARVKEIAESALVRVWADLGRRVQGGQGHPGGGGSGATLAEFAVWNPGAGGRTPVEAEIELDGGGPDAALSGPGQPCHVRDARGRALPTSVVRVEEPEEVLALRLPRQFAGFLTENDFAEFLGYAVQDVSWSRADDTLQVVVHLGRSPVAVHDLAARRAALREAVADPAVAWLDFRARTRALLRLGFVDELPGAGLRVYRVEPGHGPAAADLEADSSDAGARIANDFWSVAVDSRGSVRLERRADAAGGLPALSLEDALRLVSEGDRGDEYNFDPVPEGPVVDRPARVEVEPAVVEGGDARLRWRAWYRVPASLACDRARRDEEHVELPVRCEIQLHSGVDRVDLVAEAENRASDHRLRIHWRAPFEAERFEVESAFEIARRPIEPPPPAPGERIPAERPIGASPQRQWAGVAGRGLAMSVASRGLCEVEALRDGGACALAVTWWRAVGWLSRGDLVMRPGLAGPPFATPGAQVPGTHRAALSLRWHTDGDARALVEAHRFAFPPRALPLPPASARCEPAAIRDGDRLVEIDDPRVVLSAIEPAPSGAVAVRCWNLRPEPVSIRLRVGPRELRALARTDLLGRPRPGEGVVEAPGGGPLEASLELGACEIASFLAAPGPHSL